MSILKVDYNLIDMLMSKVMVNLNNQINELKIKDSDFEPLFYANNEFVKQLMIRSKDINDETIDSIKLIEGNSDLIVNSYEGGFKLWEGLYDIIDYFKDFEILNNICDQSLNVLELGCGSGLASIYLSKKLINSKLYLQDFNEEVLKYFTAVNVFLNNKSDSQNICRFNYMFGDWNQISLQLKSSELKFDLIISSETLYNCDNFENFVNVIKTSLAQTGVVYIASKSHYFGVGGGTFSFIDYIESDGQLECKICHEIEAPLLRQILKLNFKK